MDAKTCIMNVGKSSPTASSKLFSSIQRYCSQHTNLEEKELLNHIIPYRDILRLQ